jgi:hypothetical protein
MQNGLFYTIVRMSLRVGFGDRLKVEFDSKTVDEVFLGNCIVEFWELRKNIIDEIKRRGL